jgi:hypothetical protein
MYDILVKLLGAGISAIIFFSPVKVDYQDETILIDTRLHAPVTEEIAQLVERGFVFGLVYYISIIINDSITFNQNQIRRLSYRDRQWQVNNTVVTAEQIQQKMGKVNIVFTNINLKQDDRIVVFIKATIMPDTDFKKSVGMSTRILWNHYVPKQKKILRYDQGELQIE